MVEAPDPLASVNNALRAGCNLTMACVTLSLLEKNKRR